VNKPKSLDAAQFGVTECSSSCWRFSSSNNDIMYIQ